MAYYDLETALLDRRAYVCEEVFRRERETAFADGWLALAPAAWVAEPGTFYSAWMGPEPAILWRLPSGALSVIANRCPFGTKALTSAARGRTAAFVCACHGRAFGADAALAGPLAAAVADAAGLIFASRHTPSRPLAATLAAFQPYLDALTGAGGAFLDEALVRWRVRANWKIVVDGWCAPSSDDDTADGFQAATEGGVAAFAGDSDGDDEGPLAGHAPLGGVLFPNLGFEPRFGAVHICHPLTPTLSEIRSFGVSEARFRAFGLGFTAGGDGASQQVPAWESVQRNARDVAAAHAPLNLQRGRGAERRTNLPGVRGELLGDTNARAFHSWWQAQLQRPTPALADRVRLRILESAAP